MKSQSSGWVRVAASLALLAAALAGCGTKPAATNAPAKPPEPNPAPKVADDVASRLRDLDAKSAALSADAKRLPGGTDDEHRQIMHAVFGDLSEVLPLLDNPERNRILAQRLAVIEQARAQLARPSAGLAFEPAVDTGLRAAANALADVARASYYDQASLAPLLDNLSSQVNRLDLDHGPLHRVDVGSAVDSTSQIIAKMAQTLSQRQAEQSPATAPASEPAAAPAAAQ